MNEKQTKKLSKFLSLVLRHQPQKVGLTLDESGWVDVDELLEAVQRHGRPFTRETLENIVKHNDKQRFAFSNDGKQIRANQGHSVAVELGYVATDPPEFLYHGAPQQFIEKIFDEGLKKMERHHVHLHTDRETCLAVGMRRGKPVLLIVRATDMVQQGHEFYMSDNGVWLTDHVPPEFLSVETAS